VARWEVRECDAAGCTQRQICRASETEQLARRGWMINRVRFAANDQELALLDLYEACQKKMTADLALHLGRGRDLQGSHPPRWLVDAASRES